MSLEILRRVRQLNEKAREDEAEHEAELARLSPECPGHPLNGGQVRHVPDASGRVISWAWRVKVADTDSHSSSVSELRRRRAQPSSPQSPPARQALPGG